MEHLKVYFGHFLYISLKKIFGSKKAKSKNWTMQEKTKFLHKGVSLQQSFSALDYLFPDLDTKNLSLSLQ